MKVNGKCSDIPAVVLESKRYSTVQCSCYKWHRSMAACVTCKTQVGVFSRTYKAAILQLLALPCMLLRTALPHAILYHLGGYS